MGSTTSDPIALTARTLTLAHGLGVTKNKNEAYKVAQLAYDTEHPAGVFALAYCYSGGIGVERNMDTALKLVQKPGLKDFPLTDYLQATLLLHLKPGDQETRKHAISLFERAHKGGMISARLEIIGLKHGASPKEMTDEEVLEEIIDYANQGNPVAQRQTYIILLKQPILTDEGRAVCLHYLTKAAQSGSVDAQYRLAEENFRTHGFHSTLLLKQNYVIARNWATLAANHGHKNAHQILAIIYLRGHGTPHDDKKAHEHYEMQKKLGADNQAQFQQWWERNVR